MPPNESVAAARKDEDEIARLFESAGWHVDREPTVGSLQADLRVSKKHRTYLVEIKSSSEGRPDRVIALLALAVLQAQSYARAFPKAKPLAIVRVGTASSALLEKVDDFRRKYASDVGIGVVSGDGMRHFAGSGLDEMNARSLPSRKRSSAAPARASDLFSDLNQWMLKVLLAPEIPTKLLTAPRGEYRNVSQLAEAADVSVMSAFRFAARLREEGFLDESASTLQLVRRGALFRRWQSAAQRSTPEWRMRFLMPGTDRSQLRTLLSRHLACLGLFAAAEHLGIGHVSGVPPYVYVPRTSRSAPQTWKELVPALAGEPAQLIVKQASAPQSLFRGAISEEGVRVADVLQVWLDASAHPSRGSEQAELISRTALRNVIGASA